MENASNPSSEDSSSSSSSASSSAKLKASAKLAAVSAFSAGASLAKKGFAFGKEKAVEAHQHLKQSEHYVRVQATLAEWRARLPSSIRALLDAPSIDSVLQHPEALFQIAAILEAIQHPKSALFQAAIAGTAQVALESKEGGEAVNKLDIKQVMAKGSNSVLNKYNPSEGSQAHAMVKGAANHIACARASGADIAPAAVLTSAVAHGATHTINATASAAIKEATGISMKTNFEAETIAKMAKAIKPDDLHMIMGVMKDLHGYR